MAPLELKTEDTSEATGGLARLSEAQIKTRYYTLSIRKALQKALLKTLCPLVYMLNR